MRVLLAEHEPACQLALHRFLDHLGYDVRVARDGVEAWTLFQTEEMDVVISDALLPGIDCAELCRRMRAHVEARSRSTYVIQVTALEGKELSLQDVAGGADDYLTIPVHIGQLATRLRTAERVLALSRQVSAQQQALEQLNRELHERAQRDPLTGLCDRLQLCEDLESMVAQATRYGRLYSVMLLNVDRFKLYNDTHGYGAGDEALKAISCATIACCRVGDVAYRYGGDQFLVILPEQDIAGATVAAERVHAAVQGMRTPHAANAPFGVLTISIGVAVATSGKSVKALLHEATTALRRAKDGGRNCVVAYGRPVLRQPAARIS